MSLEITAEKTAQERTLGEVRGIGYGDMLLLLCSALNSQVLTAQRSFFQQFCLFYYMAMKYRPPVPYSYS